MWDTTISLQPKIFLYSLVLGIIISVFFDFFRALRKIKDFSDLIVFFQDIIFFVIVTPTVFIFLLAFTYGVMRAYVFVGIIAGFVIWRITLSRYYLTFLVWIFSFTSKILHYTNGKVSALTDKIILFFEENLKKLVKIVKKAVFLRKKLLKK